MVRMHASSTNDKKENIHQRITGTIVTTKITATTTKNTVEFVSTNIT